MKINKKVELILTPDEVKEILVNHLAIKGFEINEIYFGIYTHTQDDDMFSSFPPVHSLDNIICKGNIIQ